jgi:plasmid stabilization system protein ParE
VNKLAFLPAAEVDYLEALTWYLERSEQAAAAFETGIQIGLERIAESPDSWPSIDDRHQFYLLRRFPSSIVYRRERNTTILIVAIAHSSRDVSYCRKR